MKSNHSYCCCYTEYMQHTQPFLLREMRKEQKEGSSLRNSYQDLQDFLNVNAPSSQRRQRSICVQDSSLHNPSLTPCSLWNSVQGLPWHPCPSHIFPATGPIHSMVWPPRFCAVLETLLILYLLLQKHHATACIYPDPAYISKHIFLFENQHVTKTNTELLRKYTSTKNFFKCYIFL